MRKVRLMRSKLFLLLFFTTSSLVATAQQDIQFSQYIFNGLSVNPAYAGYKEDMYLNTTYRKQWVSFPGAPETGTASIDGVANLSGSKTVGLGAQVLWDKLGPQQSLSFYGSYAYRIRLNDENDSRLSLGLGLGINQYSIDGNKFSPIDQNDPNIPVGKVSTLKPNANFGIYYYNPTFYAGLSVLDLFPNNMYDNIFIGSNDYGNLSIKKTRHYYFTAGTMLTLREDIKMKPSIMIKDDFKGPTNLDFNVFFLYADRFWLGGSYRTGVKLWSKSALQSSLENADAMSIMAEVMATDRLRLGYAYDFTTSKLANYQSGTHEISIGYLLFNKRRGERTSNPRYF